VIRKGGSGALRTGVEGSPSSTWAQAAEGIGSGRKPGAELATRFVA
jgi:hypothetical protein